MLSIDLNCDMGEGCPNDAELMRYVSSVNIACGYHAGDAETMKRTVELAVETGCAIGAHPGYRDRDNFGRTEMDLSSAEIYELVIDQVDALNQISGGKLRHVKPHGALYNRSARDPEIAAAIARAVRDCGSDLILFGLSGSVSISEAERVGLRSASEVFADRTYRSDGSLIPRTEQNALIDQPNIAVAQVMEMVTLHSVTALDGSTVAIVADTICIHGDGPTAVTLAGIIHRELIEAGVEIGPVI